MKRTGVARTPLRKGEQLRHKIEAQLAAIRRMRTCPIIVHGARCRLHYRLVSNGAFVVNSIEGAKFVTLEASHISNIEYEANFIKVTVDFLTAPETAAVRPLARVRLGLRRKTGGEESTSQED